ncbi:Ly6/PLAUR domain-containing protein 4 [Myotis brandtii]|uniref:Ly6/PLAUR domain-containing protein 4 n=1 Tax=Myotis brandtii TaxID=109478 RepID=S7NPN0_MYOBR|nr:Ly6/PLAUR domain-containing protein 4 [Myotis brandtii]
MVCKLSEGCEETLVLIKTGLLNTTFLLMGCAREYRKLLADFRYIGTIRVTEALNVLQKAQVAGAEPSSRGPAWGILSGLLLAFRD